MIRALGTIADGYQQDPYVPYPVESVKFTETQEMGATGTNIPDGTRVLCSFWIHPNGGSSDLYRIVTFDADQLNAGASLNVLWITSDLRIVLGDRSARNIYKFTTTGNKLPNGKWSHVLFTIKMDSPSIVDAVYINDRKVQGFESMDRSKLIGWGNQYYIGRHVVNPPKYMHADLSEIWVAPNQYLDVREATVRRKFTTLRSDNGLLPRDLGADGSTPTGTSPTVYLKGNADVWNTGTNFGDGANFGVTGTILPGTYDPVQSFP